VQTVCYQSTRKEIISLSKKQEKAVTKDVELSSKEFRKHQRNLKRHEEKDHNIKQTIQNHVLGFECDLGKHIENGDLEAMDYEIYDNKCDYKGSYK
jgi:hypothetical protein